MQDDFEDLDIKPVIARAPLVLHTVGRFTTYLTFLSVHVPLCLSLCMICCEYYIMYIPSSILYYQHAYCLCKEQNAGIHSLLNLGFSGFSPRMGDSVVIMYKKAVL